MGIHYYFEDTTGEVIPLGVVRTAAVEWYCRLHHVPTPNPESEEWTTTEMVPIGWLEATACGVRHGKETIDEAIARYSDNPERVAMLLALQQRLCLGYICAYRYC